MKPSEIKPIETLRFSDRDREELLESVETASVKPVQDDRRRLRVQYTQAKAVLSLFSETGAATKFVVMPRNLSRMGVAFVHGRFMFPGTRCEVMLQQLDEKWDAVAGIIKSCRHVQGMVHEIAVVFDNAIDLPCFVELSPEQEMLHLEDVNKDLPPEEASRVERMTGRVLVIDTFPVDRKLFALWLSRAGFVVETVGTPAEAVKLSARSRYDLVVCDVVLGAASGLELMESLRGASPDLPMLAMSADEAESTQESALEAGATAFLAKPFSEEELIDNAQSLLGIDLENASDVIPIFSTSAADEDMRPLLAEFIRGLSGYITQLRDANANKDLATIKTISRTLKGAGAGYGLVPISETAASLADLFNAETPDPADIKAQVNDLVQVLNRVRM